MDWVHCNICFGQLAPGITLSLTSCGHMFCNRCLENGVKGKICRICNTTCNIMKLVPEMSLDVQDFFMEPEEIVNKLLSVLEFQRKHRMRLTSYWVQLTQKYQTMKNEVRRLNELVKKLNDVFKETQKQNKLMKSIIREQSKKKSPFAAPFSPNFPCKTPQGHYAMTSSTPLSANSQVNYASLPDELKNYPHTKLYQSNLVTSDRVSKQRTSNGFMNTPQPQVRSSCNKSPTSGFQSPNTPHSGSLGYFSTSASSGSEHSLSSMTRDRRGRERNTSRLHQSQQF